MLNEESEREVQAYLELLREYQETPGEWYGTFEEALEEIKRGEKLEHWIWYVFPQTFLAKWPSSMAKRFHIRPVLCLDIAEAILEDEVLGKNFVDICQALQTHQGKPIRDIMGSKTDADKLLSCLTLFSNTRKTNHLGRIEAEKALEMFYPGKLCEKTMENIAAYYPAK